MTHVFFVDDNTFKYHLEYMFAGTGAGDKKCMFLSDSDIQMHHSTERNLVGMIADISRVRIGDNIIFYLQANSNHEGMFFGVFRAASNAFFDENDDNNYLKKEGLGKGLSFRVLIEPKDVYPIGITEHRLLDDISCTPCSYMLCWSLIYRKLKGNRGCTMITDYEYKYLLLLLSNKNNNKTLDGTGFTYNSSNNIITAGRSKKYMGRQDSVDITARMFHKASHRQAFETHLQAYIVQTLNANNSPLFDIMKIDSDLPFWLGNEVACGVGMQRIDILIIQELDTCVKIIPIELKDEIPELNVFKQIDWYVTWIKQYLVPNLTKKAEIYPYIIAKETNCSDFYKLIESDRGRDAHSFSIAPYQYIAFEINKNKIFLKQIR